MQLIALELYAGYWSICAFRAACTVNHSNRYALQGRAICRHMCLEHAPKTVFGLWTIYKCQFIERLSGFVSLSHSHSHTHADMCVRHVSGLLPDSRVFLGMRDPLSFQDCHTHITVPSAPTDRQVAYKWGVHAMHVTSCGLHGLFYIPCTQLICNEHS